MNTNAGQNMGNLTVLRGGKGRFDTTPETVLDREVREKVVALMRSSLSGGRDRSLENIAGDLTHPTRNTAKAMRRLSRRRKSLAQIYEAVIVPQIRFLFAIKGRDGEFHTGEFHTPTDAEVA